MKKTLFFILTMIYSFTGLMNAQTVLYSTDDVYLYKGGSGTGNEIRGMEKTLNSYRNPANSSNTYNRIIYLKFDLRQITKLVDIIKFRLYGQVNEAHGFDLYTTSLTNWTGDGLTYNNAASLIGTVSSSPIAVLDVLGNSTPQYYEWNITSAVVAAIDKGESFLSIKLQDRYAVTNSTGGSIIVQFHSNENSSGNKPQLQVNYKNTDEFKLSELKLDNVLISGFQSDKLRYDIALSSSTVNIPSVSALASNSQCALKIIPAINLTGTEAERTTRVISKINQDSVVYKVVFANTSSLAGEARLDSLYLDNISLENFRPDSVFYRNYLPYTSTSIPEIRAIGINRYAHTTIVPPSNLNGTAQERTASISVLSENGQVVKSYTVEFQVLPKLDIFLAFGQSNMSGRGYMVASDSVPIDNVYLLTPGANLEIASNPLNKYSSIEYMSPTNRIGPANSFVKMMQNKTKQNIGLMQNSKGGSSIDSWLKGSTDKFYDEAIRRSLEIRKFGEIKGIIWHQGESDTSDPNGYKTKLLQMVTDFRSDLGIPNLFFIAGQIATWRSVSFSNMIATIQSFIPNSDWVSSDGLTPLVDTSDPHFDAASQKILGERYAEKMLLNVYNNGLTLNPSQECESEELASIDTVNKKISINVLTKNCFVRIYDVRGKCVINQFLVASKNLFSLSEGVYLVQISNGQYLQNKKILL